jgi:hypothetical protein
MGKRLSVIIDRVNILFRPAAPKLAATPAAVRCQPPGLDANRHDILADYVFDAADIEDFSRAGACADPLTLVR